MRKILFSFLSVYTAKTQYRKLEYSQKRNYAASVPISLFMCLWAIYIFPGSVCQKNQHVAVKNVKCIIFYPISSWAPHYTELPRFTPAPPPPSAHPLTYPISPSLGSGVKAPPSTLLII
jgi:hypothetical protein